LNTGTETRNTLSSTECSRKEGNEKKKKKIHTTQRLGTRTVARKGEERLRCDDWQWAAQTRDRNGVEEKEGRVRLKVGWRETRLARGESKKKKDSRVLTDVHLHREGKFKRAPINQPSSSSKRGKIPVQENKRETEGESEDKVTQ